MNTENNILSQQRERLKEVFSYLKSMGYSQKDIADELSKSADKKLQRIDESTLSSYKSGKIKHIPNNLLEELHNIYNINPDYIRLESNLMFDNFGDKYKHFDKLFQSWHAINTTSRNLNGKDYDTPKIYLEMDRNFFDFLFDIYKVKCFEQEGIHISPDEIENLKKLYDSKDGKPNIQEFVLLPRTTYCEIIDDRTEKNKKANEVLSILFPDNKVSDF